jgi:hypothetical protein
MLTPSRINVFRSHPFVAYRSATTGDLGERGLESFVNTTLGPMKVYRSIVTPSQMLVLFLMVTPSPITTPDSMKQ